MDWETEERMPKICGVPFKVVVNNQVREVIRLGLLGVTFFRDCTHPLQNMWCDENQITAWKLGNIPD